MSDEQSPPEVTFQDLADLYERVAATELAQRLAQDSLSVFAPFSVHCDEETVVVRFRPGLKLEDESRSAHVTDGPTIIASDSTGAVSAVFVGSGAALKRVPRKGTPGTEAE